MINLYLLGFKGLKALTNLDQLQLDYISLVIIGQDKNIDNDYSDKIEFLCIRKGLNFKIQNETSQLKAEFSIAIGWRWIIKDNSNLIVFHDSILPKYRGFNPLVTALINGDEEIGVTAIKGSNDYDKGEIISQETMSIKYPIKINDAIEKVSILYSRLLKESIMKIHTRNIESYSQNENYSSYSLWRDEKDYKINWSLDSNRIKRFIDAVGYPYKGAYTLLNGNKIIIKHSEIVKDVQIINRDVGKVIFKNGRSFTIVCGEGLLKVHKFYNENNHPIDLNKFRLRFE
jgi:methionyl-tRNA formyltransferase